MRFFRRFSSDLTVIPLLLSTLFLSPLPLRAETNTLSGPPWRVGNAQLPTHGPLESKVVAPASITADELWRKIGNFCGLVRWHPSVQSCELSPDGKERALKIKGGGAVLERLERWDDQNRSFSYKTIISPWPIREAHSTIKVNSGAGGAIFYWTSHYSADGRPDMDVKSQMDFIQQNAAKQLLVQ